MALCTGLPSLLVGPGVGWALTFEDGYEAHALECGAHTCRPAFAELDGFAHADPWADVPAFHLAYLRSATAAYRAGRITFEGRPSAIGGTLDLALRLVGSGDAAAPADPIASGPGDQPTGGASLRRRPFFFPMRCAEKAGPVSRHEDGVTELVTPVTGAPAAWRL